MTTRGTTQRKFDVGGVEVSAVKIAAAIETLVVSNGIMIKSYLTKAAGPLAACDYHAVANAERQATGEIMQTKVTFIAALRRIAPE